MKIVLVGNPNVGKSALFNRLTGADVVVSNYAGTTVEITRGSMYVRHEKATIIDSPGSYSLDPSNKAEEVTRQMLNDADMVINVIDATNLERNLALTLELLLRKYRVIVALNIWDETTHRGIHIDHRSLSALLGVPVIPVPSCARNTAPTSPTPISCS